MLCTWKWFAYLFYFIGGSFNNIVSIAACLETCGKIINKN